jgi:MYXO-CTERM domain-containing protein
MAADGWGASYSFGPTTSRIIHAKTTLVPGRLPPITSTTGPLFLWPGMSNPTSDLIQTTMDAWPNNNGYCGAATGQWCVEASVFGSFGQRNGPNAAIDPDDHVTIEYVLGTDGNTWTQTVTSQKLAKVVSTLQSASGQMPKGGFGFATEADADSYTIDTQYYLCTELDLADADPHFAATGVGGVGAQHGATGKGSGIGTAKNVHTPDGGLTWLVDLITLPAMQPQGTQTGVPTTGTNCAETSGTSGTGGAAGTGGTTATGGSAGTVARGGTSSSGGAKAEGGSSATGGSSVATAGGNGGSGGQPGTGGEPANTGGAVAAGGVSTGSGGVAAVAGTSASAGNVSAGGADVTGDAGSNAGSCSCRIPGKPGARAGFAGGVALLGLTLLRLRRRRRSR